MGILRVLKGVNGFHRSKYDQKRVFSHISNSDLTENPIFPVLIVGAGPVGLVLSILLTKFGVKCAVLEKNKSFPRHPQAHFINNRSMEVFRKLNGLADDIVMLQSPVDLWRKFIYCTSLTGRILNSVDQLQPQDLNGITSPVSVAHFSQYKLASLLIKQLKDIGFHVGNEESIMTDECRLAERKILLGHECISINANDHGITVTTSSIQNGKHVERDFLCNYLVGTDGAGSTVRKLMGIHMNGSKDLQKLISVHFMSQDLGQYLINERPGMLYFVFNTEVIGVIVAHDLLLGEFVLQIPFYPPQQKFEDYSFEMCERLIFRLVGRELSDINVLDVQPWVMHAEVAEKFLAKNNHVILAGDAAHRFPPAGGFGMNTGIQDAHNLAWKLALVLKGIAPPSILTTYEMEREQVAIYNTALSVENFKAAMAVPSALGLDPTIANTVHQTINSGLGNILPSYLQRTVLEGIFRIGRLQLSEILLNDSNPLGSSRVSKVKQIFAEGKSLQLQFPAEDLGFRYARGALIPDEDSSANAPEPPTGRRRNYVPSTNPGSRLPHMKIKRLNELSSNDIFSTLDLVSANNLEFILIIAPLEESYIFAQAAFKVAEKLKIPLKVCVLWQEKDVDGSEVALRPWKNFIDVIEVKDSTSVRSWWDLCQMNKTGAILVRPDEHIAWRSKSEISNDPFFEAERVFRSVLRLDSS